MFEQDVEQNENSLELGRAYHICVIISIKILKYPTSYYLVVGEIYFKKNTFGTYKSHKFSTALLVRCSCGVHKYKWLCFCPSYSWHGFVILSLNIKFKCVKFEMILKK